MQVFDRRSPFIAQAKVGKENQNANEVIRGNELIKEYNAAVSVQLKKKCITVEKAHELKSQIFTREPGTKNELLISFLTYFRELDKEIMENENILPEKRKSLKERLDEVGERAERENPASPMPTLGKTKTGRKIASRSSGRRSSWDRER